MNTQAAAAQKQTRAHSETFYIKRNFQPGKPCADMVRRLLLAHLAV